LFTSVFDVVKRVELRTVNKKTLESLTLGGGFDSFKGVHRAQYFAPQEKGGIFLEKIIKYGSKFQENKNSSQVSMFDMLEGDSEEDVELMEFSDEIDAWILEEFIKIGCDTARSVLDLDEEGLISRTDLESETVKEVIRILKKELE